MRIRQLQEMRRQAFEQEADFVGKMVHSQQKGISSPEMNAILKKANTNLLEKPRSRGVFK